MLRYIQHLEKIDRDRDSRIRSLENDLSRHRIGTSESSASSVPSDDNESQDQGELPAASDNGPGCSNVPSARLPPAKSSPGEVAEIATSTHTVDADTTCAATLPVSSSRKESRHRLALISSLSNPIVALESAQNHDCREEEKEDPGTFCSFVLCVKCSNGTILDSGDAESLSSDIGSTMDEIEYDDSDSIEFNGFSADVREGALERGGVGISRNRNWSETGRHSLVVITAIFLRLYDKKCR